MEAQKYSVLVKSFTARVRHHFIFFLRFAVQESATISINPDDELVDLVVNNHTRRGTQCS